MDLVGCHVPTVLEREPNGLRAGVPVQVRRIDGGVHGIFWRAGTVGLGRALIDEIAALVRTGSRSYLCYPVGIDWFMNAYEAGGTVPAEGP